MHPQSTLGRSEAWALLDEARRAGADARAWLKAGKALAQAGEGEAADGAFERYFALAPGRKAYLVPAKGLASVNGVYNAVMVSCDLAGKTLYYGRGAGRDPRGAREPRAVRGDPRCCVEDRSRDHVRGRGHRSTDL